MRRGLRVLCIVALAFALVSVVTGLGLLRGMRSLLDESVARVPDATASSLGWSHVLAGHATTLVTCAAAAAAFVLGLHGLLEPGGRRVPSAALACLAPVLVGLALAVEVSGLLDWRQVRMGQLEQAPFERFVQVHGVRLTALLLTTQALVVAAAAWALRRPATGDEDG